MRTHIALTALAVTAVALVAAPSVTAAEAPTVDLRPGSIERGEDVADPHVEGRTIHDGSLRLSFRAPVVTLLGKTGERYVVHLSRRDGSNARVLWIRPDETSKVLATGLDVSQVVLSGDGRDLLTTPTVAEDHTVVRVVDADSGSLVESRSFRGLVSVLDAEQSRAVLGAWSPNRTFTWSYRSDTTQRINGRVVYAADIAADRVASYNRDPYAGGCSVVTELHRPSETLWRSCEDRVAAFSPDGRRVASIDILADGLGPASVTVRRTSHGAPIARYSARWFGDIRWETDTALLLDTNGERKAATVRCDVTDCERASDLKPVPRV